MKKIPLIIDADPGIDDFVALMMALNSKKVDVKLITCTAGVSNITNVCNNTLGALEFFSELNVPVAIGSSKPLKREHYVLGTFHGANGLGGYEFKIKNLKPSDLNAVEHIHKILTESEVKVTLVALGPLTNIANLLLTYPKDTEKLEKLVFMGGSITEDGVVNKVPYKEFNIAGDPEAAEVVFASSLNMVMVPMEMGHTAYLNWHDVFKTKTENLTGEVLEIIYRGYNDRHVKNGIATHDGTALSYVLAPEIFKTKPALVSVKYYDELESGIAVCDFTKTANMQVCTEINVEKFKKVYFGALKKCK